MFQIVQGRHVYVVVLKELPLAGPIHHGDDPELIGYAAALTLAIERGTITKPGKYAIELLAGCYNIFEVKE